MARPNTFSVDTTLYHPTEGKKVFPAGEQDPGMAWSDQPGGHPIGGATVAQSAKDLLAAQEQIDGLGQQIDTLGASLAEVSKERDDAAGALAAAEARAADAEKAQGEAEKVAAEVTGERDRALAVETSLRAAMTDLEGKIDAANKAATEANDNASLYAEEVQKLGERNKELEAQVAKFDADGDGKAGGSKKTAKPDDAA